MAKVLSAIKEELLKLLPSFLFFSAAFILIVVTEALTTEKYGIQPFHIISAIVFALVVSKVLLLTNLLPFVRPFSGSPLVYNTLWRAGLYTVIVILFSYGEHLVRFAARYHSFALANRRLIEEIGWPRLWGIWIWLAVLVLFYVAADDLTRALGRGKVKRLFLAQ